MASIPQMHEYSGPRTLELGIAVVTLGLVSRAIGQARKAL